ncbi:MAG: carboxylesterase family protein [Vicinamibacterales bacterium]
MERRAFLALTGTTVAGLVLPAYLRAQDTGVPGATVSTGAGRVRGMLRGGVHSFKGVPYAAPPVGAGRFQPPRPSAAWSGVRDAFASGPRAPQPPRPMIPEIGDALTGSGPTGEDCLSLNLWTADPRTTARRPVVVYFHGGGYRSGSVNSVFYDGTALAKTQDVVFVGVNHRLNVLGYLYLAELGGERYARSGNAGLLDLVAALEWVRDNIENFGGDPGNVTILGQSGGGGKAAMLTGMPAAKGLFHRAIIMSTLIESGVRAMEKDQAAASAERFLSKLGLTKGQLDQLHQFPVDRLIAALTGAGIASGTQTADAAAGDISTQFSAVVDGVTLPAHPYDPVASPYSADVPILCGANETEGVPYADLNDPFWTSEIATESGLRARVRTLFGVRDAEADRLIALYRTRRPGDDRQTLALIMAADNSPTRRSSYVFADRKHAAGRAPAYMYYFQWRSPVRGGKLRTMHSMELPFLFNHPDDIRFMVGDGQDRYAVAKAMSTSFMTFARTGKPGAAGLPTWKAYDPVGRATMVFNTRTRLVNDPYGDERRALDAIRNRPRG